MSKQNSPLSYLVVAGGTLLFYMCVLPIVDALSGLIQTKIASNTTHTQCTIAKNQQRLEEIAGQNQPDSVNAIGFHDQHNVEEIEYDDET